MAKTEFFQVIYLSFYEIWKKSKHHNFQTDVLKLLVLFYIKSTRIYDKDKQQCSYMRKWNR